MQYINLMFIDITKSEFTNKKIKMAAIFQMAAKYPSNPENAIFSLSFNIFSHAIQLFDIKSRTKTLH